FGHAPEGDAIGCRRQSLTRRAVDHESCGLLLVIAERIRQSHLEPCTPDSSAKPLEYTLFARAAGDQVKRVHCSLLTDAIDSPDPLREPDWIPGQLEIDDDTAGVMEVQAFAGCVGCHEQRLVPACELEQCLCPLV